MPVVPLEVDSSTLVLTSAVSAAITFGFCVSVGLKPGPAIAIAVVVGIVLYNIGVIPIGLLAVVGFAMIAAIFKAMFKGGSKEHPPE